MSSFVQVVISQNELKLLGSVEKWITLSAHEVCNSQHAWAYASVLLLNYRAYPTWLFRQVGLL